MSVRIGLSALALSAILAACGGSSHPQTHHTTVAAAPRSDPAPAGRAARPRPPQAIVTAETENRLVVVALPSGRVVRRISLPPDPEDIAAGRLVVVTSAAAGKVTLLDGKTLRPLRVLGGFDAPHIVAIGPDGGHAYVTDDARGTLTTIDLTTRRVTSTIDVGAGAHHLSFDRIHHRAWVALGESARTIVILDTSNIAHPKVTGRFDPGFPAHDLAFAPNGNRVWITSADTPDVTVFAANDRRPLFRVPVGAPPQHVAFDGRYVYLTSGYGSEIERVDAATGRVLTRATAPYGSFELAADRQYVVTSSLLRGTLAIYTPRLKLLRVVQLAPAAREVALSPPA